MSWRPNNVLRLDVASALNGSGRLIEHPIIQFPLSTERLRPSARRSDSCHAGTESPLVSGHRLRLFLTSNQRFG
jgi:hypothetical protein